MNNFLQFKQLSLATAKAESLEHAPSPTVSVESFKQDQSADAKPVTSTEKKSESESVMYPNRVILTSKITSCSLVFFFPFFFFTKWYHSPPISLSWSAWYQANAIDLGSRRPKTERSCYCFSSC